MNKNTIGAVILSNKDIIIKMYQENMRVTAIAAKYGVADSTIYMNLKKWSIPLKGGARVKHIKPMKHWKRPKSQELLAIMKENSRINNKGIQYIKFERTTQDQCLVRNIINHPIMTV